MLSELTAAVRCVWEVGHFPCTHIYLENDCAAQRTLLTNEPSPSTDDGGGGGLPEERKHFQFHFLHLRVLKFTQRFLHTRIQVAFTASALQQHS